MSLDIPSISMPQEAAPEEARTRYACEGCRRRKARCTAERPICRPCQRLDSECVYLPRDQRRRSAKVDKVSRKASKDRVRDLEAQVSDIYNILQYECPCLQAIPLCVIADIRSINNAPTNEASHVATVSSEHVSTNPHVLDVSPSERTRGPQTTTAAGISINHGVPKEMIQSAVQVYKTCVHLQPLPLFSLQDLSKYLSESSLFLLQSFLALSLSYSSPSTFLCATSNHMEQYFKLGHQAVMVQASEGVASLEVLQSLCLLALCDMKAGRPARAWITIGTATRLHAFRRLGRYRFQEEDENKENTCRCCWSIYVLENAFSHQLSSTENKPCSDDDIPSPSWPAPVHLQGNSSQSVDPHNLDEGFKYPGIQTFCMEVISVWRDIQSYLHGIRSGNVENPWIPTSIYSNLNCQLYESEARMSPRHLIRNVHLVGRSSSELSEHHEYWTLWVFMQITSHTLPAILNHPFIHLIARKGTSCPQRQPRCFLQQTVDLALFHSGWVVRILRITEELSMEINDPLIGHCIAAIATVLWFFQFVRDSKVSRKSRQDLDTCERFLDRMATSWPHIAQKLQLLRQLQAKVHNSEPDAGESTTITVQSSVLWALLDSSIAQMVPFDSPLSVLDESDDHNDNASVRLNIHIVPPLEDEADETSLPASSTPGNELYRPRGAGGSFDPFLDDFFTQFTDVDDLWWQSVPQPDLIPEAPGYTNN